tara:strand:+ start:130 stop:339 length:210 start_codon:yes stop_codon:yes gene_type:complete
LKAGRSELSPSTEDSRSEAASLVAGSTRKPGLSLLPLLEDAPDEEDGLPLDDGRLGGSGKAAQRRAAAA